MNAANFWWTGANTDEEMAAAVGKCVAPEEQSDATVPQSRHEAVLDRAQTYIAELAIMLVQERQTRADAQEELSELKKAQRDADTKRKGLWEKLEVALKDIAAARQSLSDARAEHQREVVKAQDVIAARDRELAERKAHIDALVKQIEDQGEAWAKEKAEIILHHTPELAAALSRMKVRFKKTTTKKTPLQTEKPTKRWKR